MPAFVATYTAAAQTRSDFPKVGRASRSKVIQPPPLRIILIQPPDGSCDTIHNYMGPIGAEPSARFPSNHFREIFVGCAGLCVAKI